MRRTILAEHSYLSAHKARDYVLSHRVSAARPVDSRHIRTADADGPHHTGARPDAGTHHPVPNHSNPLPLADASNGPADAVVMVGNKAADAVTDPCPHCPQRYAAC